MLIGIPEIISPELLKILSEMGHGDEIVLADANFASKSHAKRLIRYPGIRVCDILKPILKLLPLDADSQTPANMMNSKNENEMPEIQIEFKEVFEDMKCSQKLGFIDISEFYRRSEHAYAIIASGELKLYGCIILKKGVINN